MHNAAAPGMVHGSGGAMFIVRLAGLLRRGLCRQPVG